MGDVKIMKVKLVRTIIFLFVAYRVVSIELLANYKYWKSTSNQLTYDYSGNSRHASIFNRYMVTDRGLAPENDYWAGFMTYKDPRLAEYTFTFWIYNQAGIGDIRLCIYFQGSLSYGFWLYYDFKQTTINLDLRYQGQHTAGKVTTIGMFLGWNLHTMSVSIDSNNRKRVNIELYKNLVMIRSDYLEYDYILTEFQYLHLGNQEDSSETLSLILYEMWIHKGFSNISELSSLLSIYYCPNSTSTICLPAYPKTMNKLGKLCTNCINSQSCDINNKCIAKSKAECVYGLYDLETYECLFYCPNDSCICPTFINNHFISYSDFKCSCKLGYKMVSDNPPACIPNQCITYNKEGYKYKCNTLESGYTLNRLGDCCICISGFSQVPNDPLLCIDTNICQNYTILGGDYICSSCSIGYSIDLEGKCNKCDSDYVKVMSNPLKCARRIERCIDYFYQVSEWICQRCEEGYLVDESFKCYKCDSGYFILSTSPFTCALFIERCIYYSYGINDWMCQRCDQGYEVDENYKCDKCDSSYFILSTSPFTCALYIERCIDYSYQDSNWICQQCDKGYVVDENYKCYKCESSYFLFSMIPFICVSEVNYCVRYEEEGEEWKCRECKEGYQLSTSGYCDECLPGYIRTETFMCKKLIEHCIQYNIESEESKCTLCESGYILGPDYYCNACDLGYIYYSLDPLICLMEIYKCRSYEFNLVSLECLACESGYVLLYECVPEIPFCKRYAQLEDSYICETCQDGYNLDGDKECKYSNEFLCGESQYLDSSNECKECPDNCIECQLEDNINIECTLCESGFTLIEAECILEKKTEISNISTLIYGATKSTKGIIAASMFVSMVSLNFNSILSMIGTIQILNYILLYNLNLPSEIIDILQGITIFNIFPNIFEYFITNKDTLDIDRYARVDITNELFLINSGKFITILLILGLSITLLKVASCFTKKLHDSNIIKRSINKVLLAMEWNFVIGYLIQSSLELTIYSAVNIYYVSFHSIHSIVGFSISIFILVSYNQIINLISPIILFLYQTRHTQQILDNSMNPKYSILYENLNIYSIEGLYINVLEVIRRLAYGLNMVILYPSPFIQVVVNSTFSCTICYFIFIYKPYTRKLDNIMMFSIEFITFLILSIVGTFIHQNLPSRLYDTANRSLAMLIYLSIILPSAVNICISIKDLIFRLRIRFRRTNRN